MHVEIFTCSWPPCPVNQRRSLGRSCWNLPDAFRVPCSILDLLGAARQCGGRVPFSRVLLAPQSLRTDHSQNFLLLCVEPRILVFISTHHLSTLLSIFFLCRNLFLDLFAWLVPWSSPLGSISVPWCLLYQNLTLPFLIFTYLVRPLTFGD